MIRRPPISTRTDTLFPYTTLFRSFKTEFATPHKDDKAALCLVSIAARERAKSNLPLRPPWVSRSEEHTSELQSLMRISYAVFCLKKKQKYYDKSHSKHNVTAITT